MADVPRSPLRSGFRISLPARISRTKLAAGTRAGALNAPWPRLSTGIFCAIGSQVSWYSSLQLSSNSAKLKSKKLRGEVKSCTSRRAALNYVRVHHLRNCAACRTCLCTLYPPFGHCRSLEVLTLAAPQRAAPAGRCHEHSAHICAQPRRVRTAARQCEALAATPSVGTQSERERRIALTRTRRASARRAHPRPSCPRRHACAARTCRHATCGACAEYERSPCGVTGC